MKKSKRMMRKFLLMLSSALLLVSLTVGATVAYLTDTSEVVTNTFTVGSVSLTMDETKVDEYGFAIVGEDRVITNEYKLIPGHEYVKDPTVHIGDTSEDGWLFVKVENGIADIEGMYNSRNISTQMADLMWTPITGVDGVYAYNYTVKAGNNIKVFEGFGIAGEADIADYATATNADAKITVEAYLVQADGFESFEDAWEAAPLQDWVD